LYLLAHAVTREPQFMRDLVTTNDPVLLSYLAVLLEGAGIESVVFDGNMSAVQGMLGAVAQRLAVPAESWETARRLLVEADLGQWVVKS
jgi:Putative prokaryotic signal transducing protein